MRVHSDSPAAIGISRREGLGKVRHLSVADRWVQERLRAGDVEHHQLLGAENPTNVITKSTERSTLTKQLSKINLSIEEGWAKSAQSAAAVHWPNYSRRSTRGG